MPVADKFEAKIDAFDRAQKVKAWSLITGLIAAVYAVGITYMASPIFVETPDLESAVIAIWAGGAIFGAASLIALGIIDNPSAGEWRTTQIGLWVGNLVVCANTLAFPLVLPLALIPVIGGFVVLSRRSTVVRILYLSLPFVALGVSLLNWFLGMPISIDIIR